MSESILLNVKKVLGIAPNDQSFDEDVITHINSVFGTLNELGVGPEEGYMIKDATDLWQDFLLGDMKLNSIKTYMYLRVRLLFDPPTSSFHVAALEKQIEQLEWRINVIREYALYPPIPEIPDLPL